MRQLELEAKCRNASINYKGNQVKNQLFICGKKPYNYMKGPLTNISTDVKWIKECPGPYLYLGRPDDDYCPGKW